MIFTGLPVVCTPYMPAALMPIPCCPRLMTQSVELGSVEQLAEDQRDLFLKDSRPVVLNPNLVAVVAGLLDVHPDFRQDTGFFTGVERIVDRLLDRGEQRLAGIVETEQMAVLGEEFADRNVALAGRHRFGGCPPALFARRFPIGRLGVSVRAGAIRAGINAPLSLGCSAINTLFDANLLLDLFFDLARGQCTEFLRGFVV